MGMGRVWNMGREKKSRGMYWEVSDVRVQHCGVKYHILIIKHTRNIHIPFLNNIFRFICSWSGA